MPTSLSTTLARFGALGLMAACAAPLIGADDTALPVTATGGARSGGGTTSGTHSWELPPITVQGAGADGQRDDDLIGAYGQPRWSAARRFSEVRTYVIPQGQFEFEYWLYISQPSKHDRDEAKDSNGAIAAPKPEIKQQYEAELGLGYRFQLDLYQVYIKDGANGTNGLDTNKFEIRWAFADWDKIFGNPTLYAEWEQAAHGADTAEFKLLLCGDITAKWVWATNLVWEQATGDFRDRSQEWNSAVACMVDDEKLSVGVETNFAYVSSLDDPAGSHRDAHWELAAGPSLRFKPTPQAHIIISDFLPLNDRANLNKFVAIFGWEF